MTACYNMRLFAITLLALSITIRLIQADTDTNTKIVIYNRILAYVSLAMLVLLEFIHP